MNDIGLVRKLATESNQRGKDAIRKAQEGDTASLDKLAEHGSATMYAVTGEIMQIYALCPA